MTENDKGNAVIDTGASIASGLTGVLIGTAIAGPLGGIIGAVIAPVVQRGVVDFAGRIRSSREKIRVESAQTYAILRIKQRLEAGYIPRDDDFFQNDETSRSKADELFEGVLLKVQNEHQEKKIRFFGNLFANVLFAPDVPITVANYLLLTSEELSYRQLCLLALIEQEGVVNFKSLRNRDHLIPDLEVLKREEWSLHPPDFGTFGLVDGNQWDAWLNDLGDILYGLLGLNEISHEDITALSQLLEMCEASPLPLPPTEMKKPPGCKLKKQAERAEAQRT